MKKGDLWYFVRPDGLSFTLVSISYVDEHLVEYLIYQNGSYISNHNRVGRSLFLDQFKPITFSNYLT